MSTKTAKKVSADRSKLPAGVEPLLSREDVALALRISLRALDILILTGRYPGHDVRIGKLLRWTRAAHNSWVADRVAKGKAG